MKLLDGAAPCLSRAQTCKALGIPRSAWYRQQATASSLQAVIDVQLATADAPQPRIAPQPRLTNRPQKDSSPARAAESAALWTPQARALDSSSRALLQQEQQLVLATLNSERFMDLSPTEVYATLLDEGTYLCSIRTMYRLLGSQGEVKERRKQVQRPHYARPELLACRPNELWSWDITKLRGPVKGSYFQLYVILDVFSRYVVGWMVAHHESGELAQSFIEETLHKQGIGPGQLTLHADRGPSMRSQPVAQLLDNLGVSKSHSRPYVSNDNAYSESAFKTLKYQPAFPDRFASIEEARAFCRAFFGWYNQEHHHVGLALLTPSMVHYGQADAVLARRNETLACAYAAHPERFRRGVPVAATLPDAVWINAPLKNSGAPQPSESSAPRASSGQERG